MNNLKVRIVLLVSLVLISVGTVGLDLWSQEDTRTRQNIVTGNVPVLAVDKLEVQGNIRQFYNIKYARKYMYGGLKIKSLTGSTSGLDLLRISLNNYKMPLVDRNSGEFILNKQSLNSILNHLELKILKKKPGSAPGYEPWVTGLLNFKPVEVLFPPEGYIHSIQPATFISSTKKAGIKVRWTNSKDSVYISLDAGSAGVKDWYNISGDSFFIPDDLLIRDHHYILRVQQNSKMKLKGNLVPSKSYVNVTYKIYTRFKTR